MQRGVIPQSWTKTRESYKFTPQSNTISPLTFLFIYIFTHNTLTTAHEGYALNPAHGTRCIGQLIFPTGKSTN